MKKIYVAKFIDRYKIGVAENTEKRMKQLSCGCPNIKAIYESGFIANAFEVEKGLPKLFAKNNVGGEWFSDVDLEMLDNYVRKIGVKNRSTPKHKRIGNSPIVFIKLFSTEENTINEIEEIRCENTQIEKFAQAVLGIDIENIYSDLIYDVLFGKTTKELVETYIPRKYESFRNYLTNSEKMSVETVERVVGALICEYWSFDDIDKFVRNQLFAVGDMSR